MTGQSTTGCFALAGPRGGKPRRENVLVLLALVVSSLPVADVGRADDVPGLPEGWKWQSTIPATEFRGDVYSRESRVRLWVEMGWLVVRRTTVDDDFEWQVVLARASDPQKPEIEIDDSGNLDIRYRNFFVREHNRGKFRILREPKTADSPPWPSYDSQGPDVVRGMFSSWHAGGWRFLRDSPFFGGRERFDLSDFWFRFQPINWESRLLPKNEQWIEGRNFSTRGSDRLVELLARSAPSMPALVTEVSLEKDLIVGTRITLDQAARGVTGKALRDCLLTTTPPVLETKAWHNTREPIVVGKQEGHVVLLGFWSTKSAPGIAQLARVEALQRKYAKRGFVAIGIHPDDGSEEVARLLMARGVSFPVAIDAPTAEKPYSGESAARYGVRSDPAYFLIGNTGQLELGLGMEPPTEAQIEGLLLQK